MTATIVLVALGIIVLLVLTAFAWLSLCEGERRAALISLALGIGGSALLLITATLHAPIKLVFIVALGGVILAATLFFFLPIGHVERGDDERKGRFDERDIVFARKRLVPGSPEYLSYYAMRPENQAQDDRIRARPGLLSLTSPRADHLFFPTASASFALTGALRETVDGPVAEARLERSPAAFTAYIKGLTQHLGAYTTGITELHPNHIYSHIGRGSGVYGAPITLDHRYAIAFTVEMDHAIMGQAPNAPVVMESARKYAEAAMIAVQISNLIRSLGYPARAHIDGNYRVIAPLVARNAGLGDIGRMGILMTPELGPRVRLGVVTTNLPLMPDSHIDDTSTIDFCRICLKCVENCPSRAIPDGDRVEIGGVLRWQIDADKCYQYWNAIGTDCGICMSVCPYSHPDNWGHNSIRVLIRHSGAARRAALWLDDVFYGRFHSPRPAVDWLP